MLSLLSLLFLFIAFQRSLASPQNIKTFADTENNYINVSAHFSQEELEQLRLNYAEPTDNPHETVGNSKRAVTVTWYQYVVTVNGVGRGNPANFVKNGLLYIFDTIPTRGSTNGINAKDFILLVGSPAGASFAGAIRYYSNAYLVSLVETRAFNIPFDYAFVTQKARTFTIIPETRYSHLNSYSEFNPLGRLFDVYDLARGNMVFTLSADAKTLSGSINIVGAARQGNLFSTPNVPYRAAVVGRFTGSRRITF
ncbi:hypothetical protein ABW20_dc0106796 [Dactylellina cionopaga]|nr:hypothetical protein ABW20_dc0106796 [Dactylellina cionopaga]